MLDVLEKPHRSADEEIPYCEKAKKASGQLLRRLREFHGCDEAFCLPEPDQPVPLVRKLPAMKEPWFRIIGAAPDRILISDIIAACAKRYGVTVGDILSARRTARVIRPRQVGYFLARTLTLKSLPEIGRRFGNRDHTAALHGVRKIERLRQTDTGLEMDLRVIAASLGGSIGS